MGYLVLLVSLVPVNHAMLLCLRRLRNITQSSLSNIAFLVLGYNIVALTVLFSFAVAGSGVWVANVTAVVGLVLALSLYALYVVNIKWSRG